MEPDRYKNHEWSYVLGLFSMVCCIALFLFSFYLIPFLLWNAPYDVPDFIVYLLTVFQKKYAFTVGESKVVTWLIFIIPALITGYISYRLSNRIDNDIYQIGVSEQHATPVTHEVSIELLRSGRIAARILFWMLVVVVVLLLLQLLVSVTSNPILRRG